MGKSKAAAVDLGGPAPTLPAEQPPAREVAGGKRKWKVSIPYVPPATVEAVDEADAWEVYKAKWGILDSDHPPEVAEVLDLLETAKG